MGSRLRVFNVSARARALDELASLAVRTVPVWRSGQGLTCPVPRSSPRARFIGGPGRFPSVPALAADSLSRKWQACRPRRIACHADPRRTAQGARHAGPRPHNIPRPRLLTLTRSGITFLAADRGPRSGPTILLYNSASAVSANVTTQISRHGLISATTAPMMGERLGALVET